MANVQEIAKGYTISDNIFKEQCKAAQFKKFKNVSVNIVGRFIGKS